SPASGVTEAPNGNGYHEGLQHGGRPDLSAGVEGLHERSLDRPTPRGGRRKRADGADDGRGFVSRGRAEFTAAPWYDRPGANRDNLDTTIRCFGSQPDDEAIAFLSRP